MDNIIGKDSAKVIIRAESEEEAEFRTYPNTRRRVILFDSEGRAMALDLDADERQKLRRALDEIGPDDSWRD